MCWRFRSLVAVAIFVGSAGGRGADFNFREQEIENQLSIGYAVSLVDVNGDKKLDIVVVDTNRVLWYENPTWKRRVIIEDQTKKDNVCIAPYDIDGDGQIDFALGADCRPADTVNSGTIQWLRRGKSLDDKWTVYPIGTEPTVHRMRWADFDGDGRPELIVAPLQGRGARGPNFEGAGVRILRYKIPEDPTKQDNWKAEVVDDELHVSHNLWPTDLNRDGKLDLLIGSFEGVSLLEQADGGKWKRTLIGAGNQETRPNRGSSEIKNGRLRDKFDYLATIEPWHGFQAVVYLQPNGRPADRTNTTKQPWKRYMLDDELAWGHAVWCANLDDDPDEELIIGVRDQKSAEHRSGVRIYDPEFYTAEVDGDERLPVEGEGIEWHRHLIDPGGVAVEDLAAADLDGDGRIDIVAAGRATKNVRIYWNEAKEVKK